MTGFVQLKKSGKTNKWFLVFAYTDEEGRRIQRTECTGLLERGNKKKAKELLERRMEELSCLAPDILERKDVLFLTFMWDWLENVAALEVRPNTLKGYKNVFENMISKFKPFHKVALLDLTPGMIQAYIKFRLDSGVSGNSVRKEWSNINRCLKVALRQNWIPYNPAERVTLPKSQRFHGARALSVEELHHLMEVFRGDPLETAIMLTVNYGLRRSEVLGLTWGAIDFAEKKVHVRQTAIKLDGEVHYINNTKTEGSRRTMPLTDSMATYLLEVKEKHRQWRKLFGQELQENEPVCIKPHSKRGLCGIDPDFLASHYRLIVTANNLNCRFHDLRHSVVNMLRRGGCDAKQIAGFIGHSDVTTTLSIYSHLWREEMDEMGRIIDNSLFSKGA